jgi:hypothetical protein
MINHKQKQKPEKNEKIRCFFEFFSELAFGPLNKFSPFLYDDWPNRAHTFFASTPIELGCVFLFVSINLVSNRFGRSRKTQILKNKRFSAKCSVFCFSCLRKTTFFQKKPHLVLLLVTTEKVSAQSIQPFTRKGKKTFVGFLLLGLRKTLEGGIDEF